MDGRRVKQLEAENEELKKKLCIEARGHVDTAKKLKEAKARLKLLTALVAIDDNAQSCDECACGAYCNEHETEFWDIFQTIKKAMEEKK